MWTPGHILQNGKYTIEQKLDGGGFGITYLARHKNGDLVVIKTLKDIDPSNPDFDKWQQDFANEALRLQKCQHPHVVRVHELITEGMIWGMVMEYIEGEDLAYRGVLAESEALKYIRQIGDALITVHEKGLLHRDVKPRNIMMRAGKDEAVLIDFGIAREFTPDLTQTHTEYKTDCYSPPEQYERRAKRGSYTDVYSLAATLYKLLTGQEPEGAISRAIYNYPLKPPKEINQHISEQVNSAILKGLEVKPEDRPQSVKEWIGLINSSAQPLILNSETLKQEQLNQRIQRLISHLSLPDVEDRYAAAEALGKIGIPAQHAVPALIKALEDEDETVRGNAASALGNIGLATKDVIFVLSQALEDEDEFVCDCAAFALGRFGSAAKEAIPVLAKRLKRESENRRSNAAPALAQIGQAAILTLIELLKDQKSHVHRRAAQ
ncbi:MAG: protein kinase, partial [Cyanobacteriota bacterium]